MQRVGLRPNTNHIPCWDDQCEDRSSMTTQKQYHVRKEYQQPQTSSPSSTTSVKRGGRKPLSRLTSPTQADEHGRPSITDQLGSKPSPCPITADRISAQLIISGRFINADKTFTRDNRTKVRYIRRAPSADLDLAGRLLDRGDQDRS